jgi:hypothetical protein
VLIRSHLGLSTDFRHSGWHHNRRLIADGLARTDQPLSRQINFADCGSHAYVLRSLEHPDVYRIAGSSCHDRFCLPCSRERSHTIALNVLNQIEGTQVRFLTLTLKSTDEPLASLLDKLYASFDALRRRAFWKRRVKGGVAFLETKRNDSAHRWHPHFHILIEGGFMPQKDLKRIWRQITGDSFIIDIRLVRDRGLVTRYITKYASKPFDNTYVNRPHRLDEAILALKGRKLAVTFGTWRGVLLAQRIPEGQWERVDSLEDMIANAAHGDTAANTILRTLSGLDFDALYARAPPQNLPDTKQPTIDPQATWFGSWKRSREYSCEWE